MDYTILYVIGFIILSLGLIFGVQYLKKNNKIDDKTLEIVINSLGLSLAIIDELDLKNEDKILKIGNVVIDSIKYAQTVLKSANDEDLINNAIAYAQKMCTDQGIELTDSRKAIIESLVKLSVSNLKI